AVILEELVTACILEGSQLHVEALIVCRNACVADDHRLGSPLLSPHSSKYTGKHKEEPIPRVAGRSFVEKVLTQTVSFAPPRNHSQHPAKIYRTRRGSCTPRAARVWSLCNALGI